MIPRPMTRLTLTLAALALATAAHAGPVSFAEPPKRFQCLTSFTLVTKTPGDAAAYCAAWIGAESRWGCWIAPLNTIVARDGFTMADAWFGRLVKHETGHACGWTAQHED